MPSIGETLREARMRQRLDIADVETRTKIRAKYLRALENEEFGLLPGATFVKTFIRTYAEALGLDPHRLVEQYRAEYERAEIEAARPLGPPVALRDRERRRRRRAPSRGLVLAAVLLLIVAGLALLGRDGGGDEESAGSPTTTETTTAERRPARRRARPRPTTVVLRVAPITPTYACVDRGANTAVVYEGILSAPRTFRGGRLRINLGKTDVRVTLNGRPFAIPGGAQPVGYEFTPGRSRALPLGARPCA